MGKEEHSYDEICKVAYDLYEKRGRIYGYELQDWLEAEKIVMERHVSEIEKEAKAIKKTKKTPKKTTEKTKKKEIIVTRKKK